MKFTHTVTVIQCRIWQGSGQGSAIHTTSQNTDSEKMQNKGLLRYDPLSKFFYWSLKASNIFSVIKISENSSNTMTFITPLQRLHQECVVLMSPDGSVVFPVLGHCISVCGRCAAGATSGGGPHALPHWACVAAAIQCCQPPEVRFTDRMPKNYWQY